MSVGHASARSRGTWAAYALAAAVATSLAAACGSNGPKRVDLSQLIFQDQAFSGQQVLVEGRVREYRDPQRTLHFLLADDHGNRLELEPVASAQPWFGQQVDVHGVLRLQSGQPVPRFLQILSVRSTGGG
jgi:hypothetical protein